MIRKLVFVTAALALTTAALAQTDVITERRNIMKSNGAATRTGGQMAKGEIPFDLAKAKEIFANYEHAAQVYPTLFPDDSKTGGGTKATPAVWENKADFKARFDAWSVDIKKANAEVTDLATFQSAFGNLTKACGSCHNVYREKS